MPTHVQLQCKRDPYLHHTVLGLPVSSLLLVQHHLTGLSNSGIISLSQLDPVLTAFCPIVCLVPTDKHLSTTVTTATTPQL